MAKLKLGPILDDKPVKLTIDLPADIHRDLAAYALALAKENGEPAIDPVKLVPVMVARFMASDRAFTRSARLSGTSSS